MPKPFAHGYTQVEFNNVVSEIDASIANPVHPLIAAVSTLPDLKILAEAVGTGSLLSKESFQRMQEWQKTPWQTEKMHWGLSMKFDNGWITPMVGPQVGYDAVVAYLRKEKVILVCLTNTDTYAEKNDQKISPAQFISREIARILDLPLMEEGISSAKDYGGPTEKGKSH